MGDVRKLSPAHSFHSVPGMGHAHFQLLTTTEFSVTNNYNLVFKLFKGALELDVDESQLVEFTGCKKDTLTASWDYHNPKLPEFIFVNCDRIMKSLEHMTKSAEDFAAADMLTYAGNPEHFLGIKEDIQMQSVFLHGREQFSVYNSVKGMHVLGGPTSVNPDEATTDVIENRPQTSQTSPRKDRDFG